MKYIAVYCIPYYHSSPSYVYLALLKLSEPFVGNGGKASPIDIYEKDAETLIGGTLTISGWGITNANPKTYTDVLWMSNLNVVKMDEQNDELLVLDEENGKVSCGGDSGGKIIPGIIRKY